MGVAHVFELVPLLGGFNGTLNGNTAETKPFWGWANDGRRSRAPLCGRCLAKAGGDGKDHADLLVLSRE